MKKDKKNNKKRGSNAVQMLIFVLIGAAIGFVSGSFVSDKLDGYGILLGTALQLAIMLVAYYLHIIIHEGGHLIAGLLSGYQFGSFRIGSLMLTKNNGRLELKKMSLAGTGGQCLMRVPEGNAEDAPVIFYNMGGVILNIIIAAMSIIFASFISSPIAYTFFVMMALMGFIVAAMNGIPLKLAMINNDGANALELARSKESKRFFFNQFKIIENTSNGIRLRDMDDSLFPMPSEDGMKESISATGAVLYENRLMDQGRYDEALELIDRLLCGDNAVLGLYKSLLLCDKMTVLLLSGERYDEVKEQYHSQSYRMFKKQMKNNISLTRLDYAYALLLEGNESLAEQMLAQFEKCAKTHPYESDVESEREILAYIDRVYEEKKQSIESD